MSGTAKWVTNASPRRILITPEIGALSEREALEIAAQAVGVKHNGGEAHPTAAAVEKGGD
jgi:hypothetical protein